jgi:hypothetical protein
MNRKPVHGELLILAFERCFWGSKLAVACEKRQRIGVRCLDGFPGLFGPVFERIVAQVFHELWMVWSCREHLVAFPTAERNQANPKPASRFRLKDSQLEAASSEVAADGGWFFWDLNATVAGW